MSAVLKEGPDALAGLLAYVAQVRDRKLDAIRKTAEQECRALTGAARAKAREQIRAALREARSDADARIALARAEAQARVRRARQALTVAALQSVRARVAEAVLRRWADAPSRTAWIALAFAESSKHLQAGTWVVSHPPGVTVTPLALPDGITLESRADPAIRAGVKVASAGAELDATLDGLLHGGERIAALWLGEIERRRLAAELRA